MATRREESQGPKEKAESAAAVGTHAVEETVRAGRQTAERTLRAGRESAETARRTGQESMQRAADIGQHQTEQLRSLMSASTKAYREVADYSKEDVEALMQSGARLAKGLQEMGWEMMNFTQESLRAGLRAANDLMECRSVEDMVAVQRDYVKESVDILLNESAKLLQMTGEAASDAVNPINRRVDVGRRPGGQEIGR